MTPIDEFVSFDTETTGFGPNARILELGVAHFKGGRPVDRWSTLVCPPGVDWSNAKVKEALAINQIRVEDLAGKPTFEEVLHRLHIHFRAAPVWVAHNLAFDGRMLDQEYQRTKQVDFPIVPSLAVCTMLFSRKLHASQKGHKLEDAAARWGVIPDGAHRAVSDALTCGHIFHAMLTQQKVPSDVEQLREFYADAKGKSR